MPHELLECVETGGEMARGVADFRDVDHPPEDLLIYSESPERVAVICSDCRGTGFVARGQASPTRRNCASCPVGCQNCNGAGFLGIDGTLPTSCKAGSKERSPFWRRGIRRVGRCG